MNMVVVPDLPPTGPHCISRFEGEYEFLRNPYPAAVAYKEQMYATVENAYHAAKFESVEMRAEIRAMPWYDAKKYARTNIGKVRSDWLDVRKRVMHAFTFAKYRDAYLGRKLQSTGKRLLIEGNEHGDRFWGACNGHGENNLGLTIMDVRLLNRFIYWAISTARYETSAMTYSPWHGIFKTNSVQRDWDAFRRGFDYGHPIDYKELQDARQ